MQSSVHIVRQVNLRTEHLYTSFFCTASKVTISDCQGAYLTGENKHELILKPPAVSLSTCYCIVA